MVSIIIPNYNGKHFLETCLTSLNRAISDHDEVIVVDNGSSDGSVSYIKEYFSQTILVQNEENLGFSAAVNAGIMASSNEFVYLLNNDTEVEQNFLESPLKLIQGDLKIFSVNSLMLNYYNRDQIDGAGDGMTIFGWPYRQDRGNKIENLRTKQVFSSCAGATLYRKSMLVELGKFDEHFFAYLEDVDLGFRANLNGYKNYVDVDSIVYHVENGTSGKGRNEFKTRLSGRNSIYLVYKNMPLVMLLLNLPFVLVGYILRIGLYYRNRLGKTYLLSLLRGLRNTKLLEKEKFRLKNIPCYWRIQVTMVRDTFQWFVTKIRRVVG